MRPPTTDSATISADVLGLHLAVEDVERLDDQQGLLLAEALAAGDPHVDFVAEAVLLQLCSSASSTAREPEASPQVPPGQGDAQRPRSARALQFVPERSQGVRDPVV